MQGQVAPRLVSIRELHAQGKLAGTVSSVLCRLRNVEVAESCWDFDSEASREGIKRCALTTKESQSPAAKEHTRIGNSDKVKIADCRVVIPAV
jgi:hypothetical protein